MSDAVEPDHEPGHGTDADADADAANASDDPDPDTSHLDDIEDGCGCVEVWEHLSASRAAGPDD